MEIFGEQRGFRYQVMEQAHLDGVVECTFNQFYNFEPMTRLLAPPPGRFRAWLRGIAEKALEDRLSVVAVDTTTGEVAALLLADDYAVPPPEGEAPPGFEPVLALLGALHDRYAELRRFGPGEAFHHFILATWPRYRGTGITRKVGLASHALGYARGYRRAVCEVTSSVSQGLTRSVGYELLGEIRYADFEHEGNKVFAGIAAEGACQLLEGELTADLAVRAPWQRASS